MNGRYVTVAANSINDPARFPKLRVLDDDQFDAVWIAVRRQAKDDAVVHPHLATERGLDDLAATAIDAALAKALSTSLPVTLPESQQRRLYFEYLDALLAHVPR
jgi:hypothetical protein